MQLQNRGLAHLFAAVFSCAGAGLAQQESPEVRIGLLAEAQCTDSRSREAAWRVLSSASGLNVDRISTEVLLTKRLQEYDVIVFPGARAVGAGRRIYRGENTPGRRRRNRS